MKPTVSREQTLYERHAFNALNKHCAQTSNQYDTDFRKKAQMCEFHDLMDGLLLATKLFIIITIIITQL